MHRLVLRHHHYYFMPVDSSNFSVVISEFQLGTGAIYLPVVVDDNILLVPIFLRVAVRYIGVILRYGGVF